VIVAAIVIAVAFTSGCICDTRSEGMTMSRTLFLLLFLGAAGVVAGALLFQFVGGSRRASCAFTSAGPITPRSR